MLLGDSKVISGKVDGRMEGTVYKKGKVLGTAKGSMGESRPAFSDDVPNVRALSEPPKAPAE